MSSRIFAMAAALLLVSSPVRADDEGSGRKVTAFTLPDSRGDDYGVGKHLGKDVVVMAFWATWCKPCKIELAALHELHVKHREKGLVVLAISIDGPDSIAEVTNYKRKFGYTFPVLVDSETAVLERYNTRGDVPFSMVVDRKGQVVETHSGFNPGDEGPLEQKLLKLLAEEAGGGAGEGSGWFTPFTPIGFEITETLRAGYFIDGDGTYGAPVINRLNLGVGSGPISVSLRSDNVHIFEYSGDIWGDDNRIEKMFAQYKTRNLHLRGGDFYASMGRGMFLSVRKVDEVGVDTSIRGGTARVKAGPVEIRGIGGVANINNFDELDGFIPDTGDLITAGEIIVDLPARIEVAARGTYIDFEDAGANDNGVWAAGGSVEIRDIGDRVTIYAEGGVVKSLLETTIGDKSKRSDANGHGAYLSVSINPVKGLAILLEAKDYRRWNLNQPGQTVRLYHEPPTLERIDQIFPVSDNTTGGRLLVEYFFEDLGLLIQANGVYYGWSKDGDWKRDESVDNFDDRAWSALHAYLTVEKKWKSGVYLNVGGGYRHEGRNLIQNEGDIDFNRKMWHVDLDFQLPLSGPHSLGLRGQHRSEDKAVDATAKSFIRGNWNVTWGLAPHLTASVIWTYQTENKADPQLDNVAAEVVWRFADWGQIGVLGGLIASDFICAGGVCRLFPRFEGARADFVARF